MNHPLVEKMQADLRQIQTGSHPVILSEDRLQIVADRLDNVASFLERTPFVQVEPHTLLSSLWRYGVMFLAGASFGFAVATAIFAR
jgi:hypothetical protein